MVSRCARIIYEQAREKDGNHRSRTKANEDDLLVVYLRCFDKAVYHCARLCAVRGINNVPLALPMVNQRIARLMVTRHASPYKYKQWHSSEISSEDLWLQMIAPDIVSFKIIHFLTAAEVQGFLRGEEKHQLVGVFEAVDVCIVP